MLTKIPGLYINEFHCILNLNYYISNLNYGIKIFWKVQVLSRKFFCVCKILVIRTYIYLTVTLTIVYRVRNVILNEFENLHNWEFVICNLSRKYWQHIYMKSIGFNIFRSLILSNLLSYIAESNFAFYRVNLTV